MNLETFELKAPVPEQLIASFGRARLVKNRDGKLELHGNDPSDITAAKEWISLFFHEAVPHLKPRTCPTFKERPSY